MSNFKVIKTIPIGKEPHEIDFAAMDNI
ncbi:hypothetical protein [Fonticella tunisiensis]